jgi:hypothetical protein
MTFSDGLQQLMGDALPNQLTVTGQVFKPTLYPHKVQEASFHKKSPFYRRYGKLKPFILS